MADEIFAPIRTALAVKAQRHAEGADEAPAGASSAPLSLPQPSPSAADALGLNTVPATQAEVAPAKRRSQKEVAPAAAVSASAAQSATPEQPARTEKSAPDETSTSISALSHHNLAWKIAYAKGSKIGRKPIKLNMMLALQQLPLDEDAWLATPATDQEIAACAAMDDEKGVAWL